MHVRNTFDRYACLELGILVRLVFTNILFAFLLFEKWFTIQNHLLACSLKNGLQFKTIYLLAIWKMVYNSKPFACLLFEKWFTNSKPFTCLLFEKWFTIQNHLLACSLKNGLQFKTICLFFNYGLNQNHFLVFQLWFKSKPFACFSNMVYHQNH